jgi:hypothetical protein
VDLRSIPGPQHVSQAREIATPMTSPTESVTTAADLPESTDNVRRFG